MNDAWNIIMMPAGTQGFSPNLNYGVTRSENAGGEPFRRVHRDIHVSAKADGCKDLTFHNSRPPCIASARLRRRPRESLTHFNTDG